MVARASGRADAARGGLRPRDREAPSTKLTVPQAGEQLNERARGCPMRPDPAWHSTVIPSRNPHLRQPRTDQVAANAKFYSDQVAANAKFSSNENKSDAKFYSDQVAANLRCGGASGACGTIGRQAARSGADGHRICGGQKINPAHTNAVAHCAFVCEWMAKTRSGRSDARFPISGLREGVCVAGRDFPDA